LADLLINNYELSINIQVTFKISPKKGKKVAGIIFLFGPHAPF